MRKVSIAVPRNCKKYSFQRYMYCFLIEINFKINSILSIRWISSYFNKKYVTASSPKPYGMFAYRLTTSNIAVAAFLLVFLPHLFRKSTLSLLNLFLCVLRKLLMKCQLSFLVGHLGPLGPPSLGPFKSCGSLMFTTSGFRSLIVLVIT